MNAHHHELYSHAIGTHGAVVAYGHYGRPVLAFPSEGGRAYDWQDNGMIGALSDLLDAGRIKLYCVDAFDQYTWADRWLSLEERARRHGAYSAWITDQVAGFIGADTPGAPDAVVTGCSLGAYHALQFALTRADLFPVAICLSGNYDPSSWRAWGDRGDAAYFTNPTDYVPNLGGDHLDWLRSRFFAVLVAGQGAWETHPTGALPSTQRMGDILGAKGIPHEVNLWGYDVSHDWHWWHRQIAEYLPRFC